MKNSNKKQVFRVKNLVENFEFQFVVPEKIKK